MAIIKAEHISKKYVLRHEAADRYKTFSAALGNAFKKRTGSATSEEFMALDNVSFEVKQGERLGIIGRNGAGKSTLLKVLSRIVTPSSGRIEITGRVASLLEVGTGFHPELSGRENIFLNGAILGMDKGEIKRKFDEIVAFAEVEKFLDTPVKRYSSGMYVRLAFAVAAHLEPEILIVDEVLAVGDAAFQKKCLGKMQDVAGQGRTVLFVSHNMGAISSLCNRCLVLSAGKKTFDGTATEGTDFYLRQNTGLSLTSLKERTDRSGNGNFKFTSIIFKNEKGEVLQEAMAGNFLEIELGYEAGNGLDLSKLLVSVAFTDNYQNMVMAFVSDEMGVTFKKHNEAGKVIRLKIPKLLLREHLYSIRLFASYSGSGSDSVCDLIENAASLKVISTDFWNSGITTRAGAYALADGSYI